MVNGHANLQFIAGSIKMTFDFLFFFTVIFLRQQFQIKPPYLWSHEGDCIFLGKIPNHFNQNFLYNQAIFFVVVKLASFHTL